MLKEKSFWHFLLAVAAVAALIGVAVWDVMTCAEWGPPQKYWVTESCGENCWTTTEHEYRRCVRRKQ